MMKDDERISKAQSSKLIYDSTMPPGTTLDLGIDIHIIKDHHPLLKTASLHFTASFAEARGALHCGRRRK